MIFLKRKNTRDLRTGFTPTPIPRNGSAVKAKNGDNDSYVSYRKVFGRIGVSLQSKRGFTLIETLVGISILLVAVVAPLTLITSNVSAVFGIKNKVTALYLAEDAVDFVKYKIATNFNINDSGTPTNWLAGLDSCIQGGSGTGPCYIDSYNDTDPIVSCSGACTTTLKFNPAIGVYDYISGTVNSPFVREVSITPVAQDPYPPSQPQEVKITARVLWQDHGNMRDVTISEHAFSWR